jgi:hypothetical protein
MQVYKKWFFVDVDDINNPRALCTTVERRMIPKKKGAVLEINGVWYIMLSKTKWRYDSRGLRIAARRKLMLKNKLNELKQSGKKNGLNSIYLRDIKEQISEIGYWMYQDVILKKQNDNADN